MSFIAIRAIAAPMLGAIIGIGVVQAQLAKIAPGIAHVLLGFTIPQSLLLRADKVTQ